MESELLLTSGFHPAMRYRTLLSGYAIALITLCCPVTTFAQSLIPAADGTGTVVTINGQTYTITGGTQSGDGANLFHSFQELGLNPHEIAQFLAQPQVQNILARVTGGNPSVIQGLIQVLGSSNPNLYIMNPAGIVLTPTATIDVPGSFMATTSDRVGFPNGEFVATGNNDVAQLNGVPQTFSFLSANPGAIVNQANLTNPNGDIALIGGTVINLGTLETPQGQVTIAAVPDEKVLRISPAGSVLSIEIPLTTELTTLDAASLPDLLQLPTLQSASAVQVNADGTVSLQGSEITIEPGDAIVAGTLKAKTIHLAAANRVEVADPAQVITGDGAYSAPTVTRFAQTPDDPNALIFLDALVENYQDLLYAGQPGSTTVVVTPDQDGIATLSDTLKPRKNVDEVHIVSDGNAGEFWLGQSYVSAANVGQYQSEFQSWQASLSPHADLLLYSCLTALGSAGENLVGAIAQSTGADVAASTTLTGSAALGGDWQLEYQTGAIEADVGFEPVAIAAYEGLLDVFTANNVSELIGYMNIANSNGVADTINLLPNTQYDLNAVDNFGFGPNGLPIVVAGTELTIQGMGNSVIQRTVGPSFRFFQVDSGATFTLSNVTLRGGQVESGYSGGAIAAATGSTINVMDSVITGNAAGSRGGAISASVNATVNATNSVLTGNSAGYRGGAIYNYAGTINISNSTIANNSASNGGALFNNQNATSTITNSTLTGNSAGNQGGAIAQNGPAGSLTLRNATVVSNVALYGGGLHLQEGVVNLNNSIVAGNAAFLQDNDIFYSGASGLSLNSNGRNLMGTLPTNPSPLDSSSDLTFASVGITNIGEVLFPLGDYGGPTQTYLPRPDSVVINGGAIATGSDQRGGNRTRLGGTDIGAVEFQGFDAIVTGDNQSTVVNTPLPAPLTGQMIESLSGQVLPNLEVTLTAPPVGASLNPPNASQITGPSGTVNFALSANDQSGSYTVQARLTGFPSFFKNLDFTNLPASTSGGSGTLPPDGGANILPIDDNLRDTVRDRLPLHPPRLPILTPLPGQAFGDPEPPANPVEHNLQQVFFQHLGLAAEGRIVTPQETTATLRRIATQAQINPVLIYAFFQPSAAPARETAKETNPQPQTPKDVLWELSDAPDGFAAQQREQHLGGSPDPQPDDVLELVVVFDDGSVVRQPVPEATRSRTIAEMRRLRRTVQNVNSAQGFYAPAQQLYQWLIAPIAGALDARDINNLSFILDQGLRSIPLAALHNGETFIIEHYSVGMMPSLSLTDTQYTDLNRARVLGVGASTFPDQHPLPSVPVELAVVTTQLGTGRSLLNEAFTLSNIRAAQREETFNVLHLATHGTFQSGELDKSYIQLWDQRLQLNELSQLGLSETAIDLLVLSACQTAVGDEIAELGFAGMAVLAGVPSVLGSLWYVSDAGTLGLMSSFYQALDQSTTKTEALRQAQLSLLHGAVRVDHGQLSTVRGELPLPAAWAQLENGTLEHPYYWSAFTMIGSPW